MGIMFRRVAGVGIRVAKNAAIGGLAGYTAASVTSDSGAAPEARRTGLRIGAIVGAITGVPLGGAVRLAAKHTEIYGKGLVAAGNASRGQMVQTAANALSKASVKGRLVFRRIGGRIVPIGRK